MLRKLAIVAGVVSALLIGLAIYLAFGDLTRHKGRIESLVSQRIGRPFAIDGPFRLELFPAMKVEAGNVRIGNAPWASEPQMLQVGRVATEINLWSLLSGPVDIRSLELRDVTVMLERNSSGDRNWALGKPGADKTADNAAAGGLTKLPFAFRRATVSNLKAILRSPGVPDRVATVESLTILPGADGLLALQGSGTLDGYRATLTGQAGPLESLLSGRNIRLDLEGGLGNLRFTAKGGFGRLNPLDGADLRLSAENPDLGTMLKNLRLPALATGNLDINATLKDAGEFTHLDFVAKTGVLSMHTVGKLSVLGLRDSDLKFEAEAADAGRLAQVFDIKGVPAAKLAIAGRIVTGSSGLTLEGVHATLGGYQAKVDGTIPARRNRARQLRFSLTVPNLAELGAKLPSLPMSVSGEVEYKAAPKPQAGAMKTLLSSRDVRLDLTGTLGSSRISAKGGFGRLDPMEGADFTISASNSDGGKLLENLRLPAVATGQVDFNATLKKAGKLTDVDLAAKIGDLSMHATGTLARLGLRDSDLALQGEAPDAARIAQAFGIKGVPTGKLAVTGRMSTTDAGYRLSDVHATLGAYVAQVDGTIPAQRDGAAQLRFDLTAPSLSDFKSSLPPLPLKLSGDVTTQSGKIGLKKLKAAFGTSLVQGTVTLNGKKNRQIDADLNAQILDLTPFLPQETAASAKPPVKSPAKKRFLFNEQPLPYSKLGTSHAHVHLIATEIRLAKGILHDVDTTVALDDGQLQSRFQARGGFGGSIDGSIDLTPMGNGSAAMKVDLTLKDMRTGFASGDAVRQEEVPSVNLRAVLTSTGATPHQLASAASGSVLVYEGPGKSKSGLLDRIGGDIIAQLISKLNPFANQDPYTHVDCMVARMNITDGKAMVAPVLLQTRKVAITANGTIDLKTEKLLLNFNTQPRQGIGISPGMFTNPFLDLTGTLTNPSIGVGGKGVASGAVAAATGGLSVLAKGVVDRAIGETNQCKEALEKAQSPAIAGWSPQGG